MPAVGRTSALLLLAASAEGARFARKGPKGDGYGPYEGKPLLNLTPCKAAELEALTTALGQGECRLLEDEFALNKAGGCADALAACSAVAASEVQANFPGVVAVVDTDAAAYFRRESGGSKAYVSVAGAPLSADFYSDWRGLDARMGRVEAAVAASGGVAKIETAGSSHEGRPIKLVRYTGSGYAPGKPKAVFTFNLHAREWIGGMAGVYAVEKFTELVKSNPAIIDGMEVVMVPMANPDGFYYSETEDRFHRKNTNGVDDGGWFCTGGVDLNRNFNSSWATVGSSGNKCSDTYHGPNAESEVETRVLKGIQTETQMTVFVDVHAYTQYVLWSWGHTRESHPRQEEFAQLGNAMKDAIENKHGMTYTAGAIAQVLYPAAGGIEDYATTLGALGYCYELRPRRNQGSAGFAPPVDQILPTAEECYEGLLTAVDYARTQ